MSEMYMIIYFNVMSGWRCYTVSEEYLIDEYESLLDSSDIKEIYYVNLDDCYEVKGNKERI